MAEPVPTGCEPAGIPVDLAAMLARREARVARRGAVLARHRQPVVSLTLVTPGPVKDTAEARYVFGLAVAAIRALLAGARLPVVDAEEQRLATGPEALFVVAAEPTALKRLLVGLEERHPLGRLWDIDVVDADGQGVGRGVLGLPARACLVCERPAHACARAQCHPLAELQRAIAEKIDAFRRGSAH